MRKTALAAVATRVVMIVLTAIGIAFASVANAGTIIVPDRHVLQLHLGTPPGQVLAVLESEKSSQDEAVATPPVDPGDPQTVVALPLVGEPGLLIDLAVESIPQKRFVSSTSARGPPPSA